MKRTVGKTGRRFNWRAAWPALVLACLVAEVIGFVAVHQSMHEYRTTAALTERVGYR